MSSINRLAQLYIHVQVFVRHGVTPVSSFQFQASTLHRHFDTEAVHISLQLPAVRRPGHMPSDLGRRALQHARGLANIGPACDLDLPDCECFNFCHCVPFVLVLTFSQLFKHLVVSTGQTIHLVVSTSQHLIVSFFMQSFSDRLESLRNGLTQKAFASKIGVPLNTYTAWLRAERLPSYEAIEKMCTVLCVSADWLLGLSTAPPSQDHTEKASKIKTLNCSIGPCQECAKKQAHIERLERVIDKLTK